MKVLVTGMAGFIGYHLAFRLASEGHEIVGIDNLNDYYDVRLKHARLTELKAFPKIRFEKLDLIDGPSLKQLFSREGFEVVVNLAAQAGVRYSLDHPDAYVQSNLVGFVNLLEACRAHPPRHLVYASSSSVYGSNSKIPFSTSDPVDHPVSLYAATKKSNELMAHSYSHLFGFPTTGLRFFTVYGPSNRPDMAISLFTKAILAGEPIQVFNHGDMSRDFTYIDDIIEGVVRVMDRPPAADPVAWRVFNIGSGRPVRLTEFIDELERELGRKAVRTLLPLQPGDVPSTHADIADLVAATGYSPRISVSEGIRRFVSWYRTFSP